MAEAAQLVVADGLRPSGFLVAQAGRRVVHRHAVWRFGRFALLSGGFFGTIQEHPDKEIRRRALKRHERRCEGPHWGGFRWIDPALILEGCGDPGIGIGLGPSGPVYCERQAGGGHGEHLTHVPIERILRQGLREIAGLTD